MDIESHESAMLLKESSSRRRQLRQGLALKLAVVLCSLGLLVNLNGPTDTNIGVTFSSNKEEKKVSAAAAAGVSSTSRPASTIHRYGTKAGSTLDVLIVQSNYPEGLEGVPVIVPARGAKWAFEEIYGRLAALQAAGAAPIIEAWLAGELPLTSFP